MGYGESKLMSECLLSKAAEISGVRSASCRVGIVAGPVEKRQGLWNTHEYIPSIFISSQALGAFSSTFPARERIDWLPVDKLAKILLEILGSAASSGGGRSARSEVFHVVNPIANSWSADIVTALPSGSYRPAVQQVPFDSWVEKLRGSAEQAERAGAFDLAGNPAIRLLDFYTNAAAAASGAEQAPRWLPSGRSEETSPTLRGLGPLNADWLGNWMVQWGPTLD